MKRQYFLLLSFFCVYYINAQRIFLSFGENQTKYDYETSAGQSLANLKRGSGNYYELGYEHIIKLKKSMLISTIGLSLNQFNSSGGDEANYYLWNTRYIGLQNSISYSFINKKTFKILATGGLNILTMLSGEQQLNNSFYDLTDQDNFKGLFIQPSLGVDFHYNIQNILELSLKYNLSKAMNVSSSGDEKLSFNNNQIAFGIHIPLKPIEK